MTAYLEPPCDHCELFHTPFACGCIECDVCGEIIESCKKPDCENDLPPGHDQLGDIFDDPEEQPW